MNSKIKTIIILFLAVTFLFLGFNVQAKTLKIAIVKDMNIKAQDEALDSFKMTIKKNDLGAVAYDEYDIYGSQFKVDEIKAKRYDLICTVGARATNRLESVISDAPIVFTMVLDPLRSNVVKSMIASGTNITGMSLDISIQKQLKLLKDIVPDAVRVGIIYGPKLSRLIGEARAVQEGIGIKIVAMGVYAPAEVPAVLTSLREKIDILLMIPDGTVCSRDSISYIINFSLKNKLPVLAFSPNLVKAGALASYNYDYQDVGVQTAEIALKILKGENPAEIPIGLPRKIGYILNKKIADFFGLRFSSALISGADSVVE